MSIQAAFAQFDVQFGDPAANFARVEQMLASAPDIDLLVLPELAFTGYDFLTPDEVAAHSEPSGSGPTSDFLRGLASKLQAVVVAGYPEIAQGRCYNSSMMVLPSGEVYNYRKIHLYSRETELFSPGDAPPRTYDTPVGRIGMMICFDWFFPEVARILTLQGAQIIAHPSNLVLPWCQRAMFARSVENHVYTITANRIGTEDRARRTLTFTGGSQILSYGGETLAAADKVSEIIGITTIDPDAASHRQLNPYNHLLQSRRIDLYNELLHPGGDTA